MPRLGDDQELLARLPSLIEEAGNGVGQRSGSVEQLNEMLTSGR